MNEPSERDRWRKREDDLLDELSRVKAHLNACLETDTIGTKAATDALEICTANAVALGAKLITMEKFIDGCERTGYRPFAWELKLIMQSKFTGESLT